MPCAPPAHQVRTPAHPVHSSCAPAAPEVKDEVPLNNQKQAGSDVASVDNGDAASGPPWWRSKATVMLMGVELGLTAAPGERYAEYKARVYQAWRARRQAATGRPANA